MGCRIVLFVKYLLSIGFPKIVKIEHHRGDSEPSSCTWKTFGFFMMFLRKTTSLAKSGKNQGGNNLSTTGSTRSTNEN